MAFVQDASVGTSVFEDFNHGYAIKALVLEGKTLAGSLDTRNAGGDRFQEIELHVYAAGPGSSPRKLQGITSVSAAQVQQAHPIEG
jgi:hypothetical protein